MNNKKNLWQQVQEKCIKENRPIVAVAPMADVTDLPFRMMIAKYSRMGKEGGGPDVIWNEFVSADGLNSPGREILQRDLRYTEAERPIIAQLFTANPNNMRVAAKICADLGYDGIDINMGCPADIIEKQGAGAKMMENPELAKQIIIAAREGAGDIPVSVKTRIGFNKINWREWLGHLLSMDLPALTIHLRTRKEMSLVPAHWELAKEIMSYCKSLAPNTVIIMNGDIKTLEEAKQKYDETGVDGVMIGRGAFGTPWFFDWDKKEKTIKEKLEIMLEHTKLYEDILGGEKSFSVMKKHYKAYVNGFTGAKELREKLFACENYAEVLKYTNEFISKI